MTTLKNIWKNVSYSGIEGHLAGLTRKEVILSNQISVILIPITIGVFYLNYVNQNHSIVASLSVLFFLLISIPIFNHFNLINFSRLLLSVLPNMLLILPPILYGNIDLGNFQGLAFTTVSLSVLPLMLFNYHNEKGWFVFSLLMNVLVVATYDVFLQTYVASSEVLGTQSEFFHSKIPQVYLLLIIIGAFVFYQRMTRKFQDELIVANEALQRKNEEIHQRNEDLNQTQQVLEEQKSVIEDQSVAMQARNKTLAEHGYIMLQLAKSEFVQKGIITGALEEIARTISLTLDVSRTSIWKIEDGEMECVKLYSRIKNNYFDGYKLDLGEFEYFTEALENDEIIVANQGMDSLKIRKFYSKAVFSEEIKSVLCAPYFVDGQLHGVVMCEQAEIEKEWSPEDINLAKVSADILTISYSSNRLRTETEIIRKQHLQIVQKNDFIESQKEQILLKNESLEKSRLELEKSLADLNSTQVDLAKKQAESRSVLDAINDHNLVVEYDLKGEITWMNERTMELTGISKKDLEGSYRYSIKSLLLRSNHFTHLEYDNFWSSLLRGVSRKYELQIVLPSTKIWVAATFLPIRNENDEVYRLLAMAHDISTVKNQQKHIEEQNVKLKDSKKEIIRINNSLESRVEERTGQLEKQNKQLMEYAFINAHLLRAPVCNILGLIDLLKKYDFDEDQMDIIKFLDTSTKELDEMVMKINRSLKKGYYDDPVLIEQVENFKRKQEQKQADQA
ncbi:MAG: hypothetical protein CL840_12750 [Crocinitomicaceae bacterium]|nr:hypothetical protein [Crocinitomicaceae bacterium]